jgi:hypothetical protein
LNQPISFEDFAIFENEPAKKKTTLEDKTTLASPLLPTEKETFI